MQVEIIAKGGEGKGSRGNGGSRKKRRQQEETEATGKDKATRQGQQDRDARIHPSRKKADPGRVRRRNKLKTETERREQGSVGVRTPGTGDRAGGQQVPTAAHSTRSMQTAP